MLRWQIDKVTVLSGLLSVSKELGLQVPQAAAMETCSGMSTPPTAKCQQTLHCEGPVQFEHISLTRGHIQGACTSVSTKSAP